jgi:hypothetical protein
LLYFVTSCRCLYYVFHCAASEAGSNRKYLKPSLIPAPKNWDDESALATSF